VVDQIDSTKQGVRRPPISRGEPHGGPQAIERASIPEWVEVVAYKILKSHQPLVHRLGCVPGASQLSGIARGCTLPSSGGRISAFLAMTTSDFRQERARAPANCGGLPSGRITPCHMRSNASRVAGLRRARLLPVRERVLVTEHSAGGTRVRSDGAGVVGGAAYCAR
jgi:hypothetical protein